jgi:CrcB protein
MKYLIWIALAGAVGTVSRFLVAGWVQNATGSRFPWGTLAVNLIGCFLFGLIFALIEDRVTISERVRHIALIGFMGAFTTFSTFGFETTVLIREQQWLLVAANLLAQNVGGILCVVLGLACARLF